MNETEFDLLTAALIGAAIGAGITLVLHHLPGGGGGRLERVGKRGDTLLERGEREARSRVGRFGRKFGDARESLRDAVEREVVRGVRRAVIRQRKRLGI